MLANAQKGDWILCEITSKAYADAAAIEIGPGQFESGGLILASFVRPAKLFTANHGVIDKKVGRLNIEMHRKIVGSIMRIIEAGE